jgi:hypothetical protein
MFASRVAALSAGLEFVVEDESEDEPPVSAVVSRFFLVGVVILSGAVAGDVVVEVGAFVT